VRGCEVDNDVREIDDKIAFKAHGLQKEKNPWQIVMKYFLILMLIKG